jgi:hypothetical protein
VALFTSYFDVAGHPDQDEKTGWMAISGFVSNVDKWVRFTNEWNAILDDLNSFLALPEPLKNFHMVDFVSRVKDGPYAKLREDKVRGHSFLDQMLECTRRHARKAFGGALDIGAYYEVNEIFELSETFGHPYSLCGHMATKFVKEWQEKVATRKVFYVFEYGDKHRGDFMDKCSQSFGVTPKFELKGPDSRPLEAADIFAWRTRDGFTNAERLRQKVDSEAETSREKLLATRATLKHRFDEVWKGIPHKAFYGDRETMQKFCVDEKVPRRLTLKAE